ncbi:hypothetical protein AGR5A_pa30026 [Agrobacterium genomosp. 5 str. CFBP 6626]|nr:hypothetical protein AGR5A_pa30026 [Agrobacterium genomosp. 5 str. CFBP 6626]
MFHNTDYAICYTITGTFYFEVRHANNFNGFTLEILHVRMLYAIDPCRSPPPSSSR